MKKRSIPRVRNIKRPTKSNPKEILAYANVIFDVTLKAAALSIIIGAFVVHNYLAGMGYSYLFSSMLQSNIPRNSTISDFKEGKNYSLDYENIQTCVDRGRRRNYM